MPFFRDLPDPGMEPASLKSPALAGGFFTINANWEPFLHYTYMQIPCEFGPMTKLVRLVL